MTESKQDLWSQWLLRRRWGGNQALQQEALINYLYPWRDTVLRHARLGEGDVLLDVGCGDGLIAFGALDQLKTGQVIFSDISPDVLKQAQTLAHQMRVLDRCRFVCAPAEDLAPMGEASVDAVTTRSVLIYVAAKQQAFNEFYRVLKPNGRLSIFEPINRFAYPEPPHVFDGYDITPVMELGAKLEAFYQRLQPLTGSMMDFDERDLMACAEQAGFGEIYLELQAEMRPKTEQVLWETYVQQAANPYSPTLEEAMQQALTPEESEQFSAYLRPLVESKGGIRKLAVAFLWAVKH